MIRGGARGGRAAWVVYRRAMKVVRGFWGWGLGARLLTLSALFMALGCAARGEGGAEAPVSAGPVEVVALGPEGYTLGGARVVSAQAVAEELASRSVRAARLELAPGASLAELVQALAALRARHITDVQVVMASPGGAPSSGALTGSEAAAGGEASDSTSEAPGAPEVGAGAAAATPSAAASAPQPEPPAPPPAEVESLPEVVVKNIGFHIGGGTNTEEEKAPFRAALEQRFDDLRRCYKLVEDPAKGGVFGVDLRVGRNGGKATVSQPRTSMRGQPFRDCVIRTFESVEFQRPAKGPTVLSYSVRFSMEK